MNEPQRVTAHARTHGGEHARDRSSRQRATLSARPPGGREHTWICRRRRIPVSPAGPAIGCGVARRSPVCRWVHTHTRTGGRRRRRRRRRNLITRPSPATNPSKWTCIAHARDRPSRLRAVMACPGRVVAVPPRFTLARVPGRYRATPVYLRRVPGRMKTKYGPMLQQWHRVDEAKGWPCRPPPLHFSAPYPISPPISP